MSCSEDARIPIPANRSVLQIFSFSFKKGYHPVFLLTLCHASADDSLLRSVFAKTLVRLVVLAMGTDVGARRQDSVKPLDAAQKRV